METRGPQPRRLKDADNAYSVAITDANTRLVGAIESANRIRLIGVDVLHAAMARQQAITQAYAKWERGSRDALRIRVAAYKPAKLPVPPLPHRQLVSVLKPLRGQTLS